MELLVATLPVEVKLRRLDYFRFKGLRFYVLEGYIMTIVMHTSIWKIYCMLPEVTQGA